MLLRCHFYVETAPGKSRQNTNWASLLAQFLVYLLYLSWKTTSHLRPQSELIFIEVPQYKDSILLV